MTQSAVLCGVGIDGVLFLHRLHHTSPASIIEKLCCLLLTNTCLLCCILFSWWQTGAKTRSRLSIPRVVAVVCTSSNKFRTHRNWATARIIKIGAQHCVCWLVHNQKINDKTSIMRINQIFGLQLQIGFYSRNWNTSSVNLLLVVSNKKQAL